MVPPNDNYLRSLRINQPNTRLTREEVKAVVDTTEATTQADLFVPGAAAGGGGAETTVCNGRAFGKTVWYDLHPDVDGAVEIQTGGFDVAINVYEFDNAASKILRRVDVLGGAGDAGLHRPARRGGPALHDPGRRARRRHGPRPRAAARCRSASSSSPTATTTTSSTRSTTAPTSPAYAPPAAARPRCARRPS